MRRTVCLLKSTLSALALLFALGCLRQGAIWIADESTFARPIFGLATERGGADGIRDVGDFQVRTCDRADEPRSIRWQVKSGPTPSTIPSRVTYGVTPPGFSRVIGPKPLPPGCYEASVRGSGVAKMVRFELVSDTNGGRVTEVKHRN